MGHRILHIAPFNTAGVPITFVHAERKLGFDSRLVTLARDERGYEEDICLELPFLRSRPTQLAKRFFSNPQKLTVNNRAKTPDKIPVTWRPNGLPEKILVELREFLWRRKLERFCQELDFWNFDLYQLDGGLEFFRDGRTVERLKEMGKKVVCCYTGSDLRTRGVIPRIDALSDANITLEFDHLALHPHIHHVLFPFDSSRYHASKPLGKREVLIGHAPTNRAAKGSDSIMAALEALRTEYPVQVVLIEGLSHEAALQKKSQCDIFVDQLGDLGYGINSLEALAMGIATCTCLAPRFEARYEDHPFIPVNESNLKEQLISLIKDPELREAKGRHGREWVRAMHDSTRIVREIHKWANFGNSN